MNKNAAKHAPLNPPLQLDGFYETLQTLSVYPTRGVFAPEKSKSKRSLHPLLYGRRPNVFRVVFSSKKTPSGSSAFAEPIAKA